MNRFLIFLSILACLASTQVRAHAMLDKAVPAVGATVSVTPDHFALTFTEDVEPQFSGFEVIRPDGKTLSLGTDASLLRPTKTLYMFVTQIGLAQFTPGRYEVKWTVVSVDTHRTTGHFTFDYTPQE